MPGLAKPRSAKTRKSLLDDVARETGQQKDGRATLQGSVGGNEVRMLFNIEAHEFFWLMSFSAVPIHVYGWLQVTNLEEETQNLTNLIAKFDALTQPFCSKANEKKNDEAAKQEDPTQKKQPSKK